MAAAHRNDEVRALLEARAARDPGDHQIAERAGQSPAGGGGLRARREGARRPGQDRRAAGDGLQPARLAAPPAPGSSTSRRWPPRSEPSNRASVTTAPSCTRGRDQAKPGRPKDASTRLGGDGPPRRRGEHQRIQVRHRPDRGVLRRARRGPRGLRQGGASEGALPLDTWNLADRRLRALGAAHATDGPNRRRRAARALQRERRRRRVQRRSAPTRGSGRVVVDHRSAPNRRPCRAPRRCSSTTASC